MAAGRETASQGAEAEEDRTEGAETEALWEARVEDTEEEWTAERLEANAEGGSEEAGKEAEREEGSTAEGSEAGSEEAVSEEGSAVEQTEEALAEQTEEEGCSEAGLEEAGKEAPSEATEEALVATGAETEEEAEGLLSNGTPLADPWSRSRLPSQHPQSPIILQYLPHSSHFHPKELNSTRPHHPLSASRQWEPFSQTPNQAPPNH